MGRLSFLLLAVALLLAPHSPYCAAADTPTTAWEAIRAHGSLSISEALLLQFPYLAYSLQDAAFSGTLFLPSDGAWRTVIRTKTTRQALQSLVTELSPATTKLRLDIFGSSTYYWQAVSNHIVFNQTIKPADLQQGRAWNTALNQSSITVASRSLNGSVTLQGDQGTARVSNPIWQAQNGKAIIYILSDAVLVPDIAPTDFLDWVGDYLARFHPSFARVLNASTASAQAAVLARPLSPSTLFAPTEEAMKTFLARRKLTLEALLKDRAACTALVQAHVVPGSSLYLWDLITNGVLRAADTNAGLPIFLNSNPLLASVQGLGSRVYLLGRNGLRAEVLAPVDLGGNPFGCTSKPDTPSGGCTGDQGSAMHTVDQVLI